MPDREARMLGEYRPQPVSAHAYKATGDMDSWHIAVTFETGSIAYMDCHALYLLGDAIMHIREVMAGDGPIVSIAVT